MELIAASREPLRHRTVGRLLVYSFATRRAMGGQAAHDIAVEIRARLAGAAGVRMIFAAAPSQADMIEALIAEPGIDWRRVTAFHMDEYIGLPAGAPQRFARLASRAPVRPRAVRRGPSDPAGARSARRRRRAMPRLLDAAPIDIVCLGIGVNGHIAFNDPPVADFADPQDVKIVELDAVCRQQQVDDDCFPNLAAVPEQARDADDSPAAAGRTIVLRRAGSASSALPSTSALHGPITTDCPASVLRRHPDCALYLDAESDPDA